MTKRQGNIAPIFPGLTLLRQIRDMLPGSLLDASYTGQVIEMLKTDQPEGGTRPRSINEARLN